MKKIIAILLLSIHLIATTELYQLLKLPILVEHLIEHKMQDNNITIFEFFSMHYALEDVRDADYERDMQLPFKTHNHINQVDCNVNLPQYSLNVITLPTIIQQHNTPVYRSLFIHSVYLSTIWQPPKTC
ncbi:hypothetical protein [Pedobacter glucosidilyticus]|uniref:hypothetical protein n=1 Tax=Pedobacter glucosidilyticus TaxID=1122941 RepID=UPI00047A09E5|nr:hypothetical protein [Pedobacter glucosidilyticus]